MSIRIREVQGIRDGIPQKIKVALCGFETDPKDGDMYLDDNDHYALAAKFARDYDTGVVYETEWKASDTQKIRDAEKDFDIKEPQ